MGICGLPSEKQERTGADCRAPSLSQVRRQLKGDEVPRVISNKGPTNLEEDLAMSSEHTDGLGLGYPNYMGYFPVHEGTNYMGVSKGSLHPESTRTACQYTKFHS